MEQRIGKLKHALGMCWVRHFANLFPTFYKMGQKLRNFVSIFALLSQQQRI